MTINAFFLKKEEIKTKKNKNWKILMLWIITLSLFFLIATFFFLFFLGSSITKKTWKERKTKLLELRREIDEEKKIIKNLITEEKEKNLFSFLPTFGDSYFFNQFEEKSKSLFDDHTCQNNISKKIQDFLNKNYNFNSSSCNNIINLREREDLFKREKELEKRKFIDKFKKSLTKEKIKNAINDPLKIFFDNFTSKLTTKENKTLNETEKVLLSSLLVEKTKVFYFYWMIKERKLWLTSGRAIIDLGEPIILTWKEKVKEFLNYFTTNQYNNFENLPFFNDFAMYYLNINFLFLNLGVEFANPFDEEILYVLNKIPSGSNTRNYLWDLENTNVVVFLKIINSTLISVPDDEITSSSEENFIMLTNFSEEYQKRILLRIFSEGLSLRIKQQELLRCLYHLTD